MNTYKEWLKSLYSDRNLHSILKRLKEGTGRIFIIGLPVHGNYGDHLIGAAEKAFFEKFFPKHQLIELSMAYCNSHRDVLKKNIKNDDVIVISGGGWMGDLYTHDEDFVRYYLREFTNKIIIFPQTIYYEDLSSTYCQEGVELYRKSLNTFICCRDKKSYDFLIKNHVSADRIFCVPDITLFFYGKIKKYFYKISESKRHVIGFCFRSDNEKVSTNEELESYKKTFAKMGYDIELFSTEENKYVKQNNRMNELTDLLSKISSYEYVLTDRLHAMIMATLVGTKCCFWDNKTNKVSGVYGWMDILETTIPQPKNLKVLLEMPEPMVLDSLENELSQMFEHLAEKIDDFIRR